MWLLAMGLENWVDGSFSGNYQYSVTYQSGVISQDTVALCPSSWLAQGYSYEFKKGYPKVRRVDQSVGSAFIP